MLAREEIYMFINTTPNEQTPTWTLFGERVESLAKDWNARENTIHPITRTNPLVTTTGFAKVASVAQIGDTDDPTFDFIEGLYWNEKKGNAAKTQIIEVAAHRVTTTEGPPAKVEYDAKKSDVLISQQSDGGEGGGNYVFGYNMYWVSDPIFGKVEIGDSAITFTADSAGD